MKGSRVEILVTGGSGFLGRNIVETLLEDRPKWAISILDVKPPPASVSKRISQFLQADLTSAESVNNAFVDYTPDIVVHVAGVIPARKLRYSTKESDWLKVKAVNYDGTKNVLDAAMSSGCRCFLYTSSCTVTMDDLDHDYYLANEEVATGLVALHYGRSKCLAENYVMSSEHAEKGLLACALRPCTIIGPGDTAVIGVMHDLIAKRETSFIVGDGYNFCDFMYIDNAVHAHMLAIENLLTTATAAGHVLNISNQQPVYFWDFLAFVWAQFGHFPAFRVHIPAIIAWLTGWLLEWITWLTGSVSTLDRGSVKDGIHTAYSSNEKAIRILGYEPKIDLAEGVRRSCEGYKRHLIAKVPASASDTAIK